MKRFLGLASLIVSAIAILLLYTLPAGGSAGALGFLALGAVGEVTPAKKSFGWKTITGALLWALGYVSSPDTLALLPPKVATIISAIGAVLAAFGLRAAQAKTQQTAEVAASEATGARIMSRSSATAASSRSPMGGS